jgi:hypothetical protein
MSTSTRHYGDDRGGPYGNRPHASEYRLHPLTARNQTSMYPVGSPERKCGSESDYRRPPHEPASHSTYGNSRSACDPRASGQAYERGPHCTYGNSRSACDPRASGQAYERGPHSTYGNSRSACDPRAPDQACERGPHSHHLSSCGSYGLRPPDLGTGYKESSYTPTRGSRSHIPSVADVDRNVRPGMHAPTGPYPHPYSGRHGLDMDSIRDSKAEIVAGITRDVMTNMRMR